MKKLVKQILSLFGSKNESWANKFFRKIDMKIAEEKLKREKLEKDLKELVDAMEQNYTLKTLTEERDSLYEQYTKELLIKLKPVFIAAESFLDEKTVKLTKWKAVELLEENTNVMILGSITFPIGAEVMAENGLSITITSENQNALQRVMRIVVPVKLAEEGNVEELQTFFKENYNLKEVTEPDSSSDFSTEELTKEQIEQMMMFHHQLNDKNNIN